MATITPFLWFSRDAEAAVAHYAEVFEGSSVEVSRTDGEGSPMQIGTLDVSGTKVMIFNGEPHGEFAFSVAQSLYVHCRDQAEVDRLWEGLTRGGEPGRCGWLVDRYGVSWQIVPRCFEEMMGSDDAAARERVMRALLTMSRLDCAALQEAFDGV